MELLRWVPLTLDERGINSGPDGYGVLDGVQTDRPGFSLCIAPLESFGPGFQDGRGDGMDEQSSRVFWTGVGGGGTMRVGVEADNIKVSSN